MKKIIFVIFLVAIAGWHLHKSNEFAVWFNSDNFYRPIYSAAFDIARPGFTVQAHLSQNYDVTHGFFLEFPCDSYDLRSVYDLDGIIRYTFWSKGVVLKSEQIPLPSRPMGGFKKGKRNFVLFTFELPYAKDVNNLTLEVTLLSPITQLLPYADSVKCKVAPAYWPK